MTIAQEFIKKLQDVTGNETLPKKFWEDFVSYAGIPTFQDVLVKYGDYYKSLSPEEKVKVSKIFWEIVKINGTPIIEDHLGSDHECDVYFLIPKDKISESKEKSGIKNDLYLQGDFHGYGSTDARQRLLELSDTGIMWRKDSMPKESIVVYQYFQVEPDPRYRDKKPVPERSPFFTDDEILTPHSTGTYFPEIPQSGCRDEYSTHMSLYPGFDIPDRILRISADSKHAHIQAKPIDWPSLLSTETASNARHFIYHATFYSDKAGDLHRSKARVTKKYHDDLHYSDQVDSAYANYTRAIQVFKPAKGNIDDIVVINDGIPYLIAGTLDRFEKMVAEKKLSPHTAFIFIQALPGLRRALPSEVAMTFDKDPSASLPGMGVRLIDYKHGIDQYIDFITNKLFPQLKKEISIPDDPSHRVMIGSSLSGTASIYIGLKCPNLFGVIIAQSPSPDNRAILGKIPKTMLTERNIYLSCGEFEHPDYAAANANIEYATELHRKLNIPLHTSAYGHQFVAWAIDLEQALPAVLRVSPTLEEKEQKKSSNLPSITSQSMLKHPKETPVKTDETSKTNVLVRRIKGG